MHRLLLKFKKNRTLKKYLLFSLLLFALSACNYIEERNVPHIKEIHPSEGKKITTVAILPFQNKTEKKGAEDTLRTCFFTNFSTKGYNLVKLEEIDERLNLAGINAGNINEEDTFKLGKIVKADALLYGTVTKCSKRFFGVYSQIVIGAEIKLVDAGCSRIIYQADHTETNHSGSVPVSPFSIPEAVIESSINVREKVITDTADRLAKKFIMAMPGKDFVSSLNAHVISIKNDESPAKVYYTVQDKDTLWGISRKFYHDPSRAKDISNANMLPSDNRLEVGQELFIPDVPVLDNIEEAQHIDKKKCKRAVYRVKWGDSLYIIASKVFRDGKKWTVIYDANRKEISNINDLPVGQVIIIPLCITGANSL